MTQLDALAVKPWGFLGLSGEHFRKTIGYTEAVGAIATLLPWAPARKAALLLLVIILHAVGVAFFIEGGEGGHLRRVRVSRPPDFPSAFIPVVYCAFVKMTSSREGWEALALRRGARTCC